MFEPSAQSAEIPCGPTWLSLRDSPHPRGEHSTGEPGARSARSTAPNRAATFATLQRPNVVPTPPPPRPRTGRSQRAGRSTCAQRSARRGQRRSVRVGGDPHSPRSASLGIGGVPPFLFFHTAEPGWGWPHGRSERQSLGILTRIPPTSRSTSDRASERTVGPPSGPQNRVEREAVAMPRNATGSPLGVTPPGRLAGVPAESLWAWRVVVEPLAGLVDLGGAACVVGGVEGLGLSSLVAQ